MWALGVFCTGFYLYLCPAPSLCIGFNLWKIRGRVCEAVVWQRVCDSWCEVERSKALDFLNEDRGSLLISQRGWSSPQSMTREPNGPQYCWGPQTAPTQGHGSVASSAIHEQGCQSHPWYCSISMPGDCRGDTKNSTKHV